ncbi:MAG: hypothetical protein Ct9H90mP16_05090 [Candidatus Poseidoniales archaeon]|nr:MAG: hypothetical protein Ct9H90mP16_05090 [Candidatus Poseidoniales archaeon]
MEDTVEIDCGTEPLNASSTPVDANDNGICDVNDDSETEGDTDDSPDDSNSGTSQYLSWTACCILLLLLLFSSSYCYEGVTNRS